MTDLKSKTARISGGDRGIGRSIAEKLAGYGATVVSGSELGVDGGVLHSRPAIVALTS